MRRSTALACLLTVVTAACSSATIYRTGAPDLDAPIVGGGKDWLYVETEDGKVVRIARRNITDIDHPGNVEALIGGGLTLIGGFFAAASFAARDSGYSGVVAVPAVMFGVPGVALLADGLIHWSGSVAAADAQTDDFPPKLRPAPALSLSGAAAPAQPPTPSGL